MGSRSRSGSERSGRNVCVRLRVKSVADRWGVVGGGGHRDRRGDAVMTTDLALISPN